MRAVRAGLAGLSLLSGAATARAQDSSITTFVVRGTVISAETRAPMPYSSVELAPRFARRLADDSGRFRFGAVPRGRYRLVIRQIGYLPFELLLTVPESLSSPLVVELFRLGITLPPVTVRADQQCRTPGPPDAAVTPELAAVFDQVVENAAHARLVAESRPFRYRIERVQARRAGDGRREVMQTDTLNGTESELQYRPGHVVGTGVGPRHGQRVVHVPTMRAFAETTFIKHHCFRLVGRDTLRGETFIRLDFDPPAAFKEADIAGSAYVDTSNYLLRYTVARVSRPRKVSRKLASLVVTTRFQQVAPWIIIPEHVFAERRFRNRDAPVEEEEQRVVDVRFEPPAANP